MNLVEQEHALAVPEPLTDDSRILQAMQPLGCLAAIIVVPHYR